MKRKPVLKAKPVIAAAMTALALAPSAFAQLPAVDAATPLAGQVDRTDVDRIAPALTDLSITPRQFGVGRIGMTTVHGGRLGFSLSEAASVRITIRKRPAAGRAREFATITRSMSAGPETVRIGHIGARSLQAGSYTADVVATDAAANSSPAYHVRLPSSLGLPRGRVRASVRFWLS